MDANNKTDLHDGEYQMCKNKVKYVIISHEKYDGNYVNERPNAKENVDIIENTFRDKLNFKDGKSYTDLSKDDITKKLNEVMSSDFTDYSSLFIFILTHGKANYQLAAKDCWYSLETVVNDVLKGAHQSFKGKPIVFIIQACSGPNNDFGGKQGKGPIAGPLTTTPTGSLFLTSIPDLFFAFASTPDIVSYRPWFIPPLCRIFEHHHTEYDINTIMTLTKKLVSEKTRSKTLMYKVISQEFKVKQVPMVVSTLTKKLIFR